MATIDQHQLLQFLDANATKDTTCFHFSKNHVSMTVTALYKLADRFKHAVPEPPAFEHWCQAAIEAYTTTTVPELEASPTPAFGADQDITAIIEDDIGLERAETQKELATAVFRYLHTQFTDLFKRDRRAFLAAMLTRYARFVGTGAFHPLLRIAFALDAGSDLDVVCGVGLMIVSGAPAPLPHMNAAVATDVSASAANVLASSAVQAVDPFAATAGGIDGRCQMYFGCPEFVGCLHRLDGAQPDEVLASMRRGVLDLFATHHDFTALHAVTGTAALAQVIGFLRDTVSPAVISDLMSCCWATLLAAAQTLPHLAKRRAVMPQDPQRTYDVDAGDEATLARAVSEAMRVAATHHGDMTSSQFEHLVKLAYTVAVESPHAADAPTAAKYVQILLREARVQAP